MVGVSEGSLVSGYWIKFLGGATEVANLVTIVPVWHGSAFFTDLGRIAGPKPAGICESCTQMIPGSPILQQLESGDGIAVPGVTYTNIMTKYDEIAVPYTTGIVEAPNSTNHVIQDYCPGDLSEHLLAEDSPTTRQLVANALDPDNGRPIIC